MEMDWMWRCVTTSGASGNGWWGLTVSGLKVRWVHLSSDPDCSSVADWMSDGLLDNSPASSKLAPCATGHGFITGVMSHFSVSWWCERPSLTASTLSPSLSPSQYCFVLSTDHHSENRTSGAPDLGDGQGCHQSQPNTPWFHPAVGSLCQTFHPLMRRPTAGPDGRIEAPSIQIQRRPNLSFPNLLWTPTTFDFIASWVKYAVVPPLVSKRTSNAIRMTRNSRELK